jgi:hypothetical protein
MDLFRDEAMCHMQETPRVDVFQGYASQGLAAHDLTWDPGSIHLWMGSTMYPTGGHGILAFYLRRFGYCLRTSNFLAGRIVMSPLWDIITVQRFMMTRVARWML